MAESPSLSKIDLSEVSEPDDGILYLYKSAVSGLWYVEPSADMALQEATNMPVGELVEQEESGYYVDSESGDLVAVYVGDDDLGNAMTTNGSRVPQEKGERNEREAVNIIGRVRGSGSVERVDAYANHDPFGIADVIAVGTGKVLLVQVKTNRFTAEDKTKYRRRVHRLDFDHVRFEVWVRVDYEGWRMYRYDPESADFEQFIEMDTCDHDATVEAYRQAVEFYDEDSGSEPD